MSNYSRFTAAAAASANRFVTSTNMANGAYTLAATTMPTTGARKVTVTHTAVTGNDTLGTILITGTNVAGQTKTETLTPVAGGTATSNEYWLTITSLVQSGWVISGGNDTITAGCDASQAILDGGGQLYGVMVSTNAAGTITLADAKGTIFVLKTSIAEGFYPCAEIDVVDFLTVTSTAASDFTVVHSAPQTT